MFQRVIQNRIYYLAQITETPLSTSFLNYNMYFILDQQNYNNNCVSLKNKRNLCKYRITASILKWTDLNFLTVEILKVRRKTKTSALGAR